MENDFQEILLLLVYPDPAMHLSKHIPDHVSSLTWSRIGIKARLFPGGQVLRTFGNSFEYTPILHLYRLFIGLRISKSPEPIHRNCQDHGISHVILAQDKSSGFLPEGGLGFTYFGDMIYRSPCLSTGMYRKIFSGRVTAFGGIHEQIDLAKVWMQWLYF